MPEQGARSTSEADASEADYWREVGERHRRVLPLRAHIARRNGALPMLIARVEHVLSHPVFFLIMLGLHGGWLVLNAGLLPDVVPWDPYPFPFLGTVTSVEAPFIALLVLMRQHRERRIHELREEVGLQLAMYTEAQITALIRMVDEVSEHLLVPGVDRRRREQMMHELHPEQLLDTIDRRLRESGAD